MGVKTIVCTATALNEVREALVGGMKIKAIKAFRNGATPPPGQERVSLRDAKHAIERYDHEYMGGPMPAAWTKKQLASAPRICAGPIIQSMVVDFGTGPCTLNVEEMELNALTQLESIGLEACGRLLELCHALQAFSEGKSIAVLED